MIAHQRYAHAKQYKRARKQLRKLKTFLGRTLRDIRRKIEGDEALQEAFRVPLWRGQRVMTQKPRDPLPKIYSLHAIQLMSSRKPLGELATRLVCPIRVPVEIQVLLGNIDTYDALTHLSLLPCLSFGIFGGKTSYRIVFTSTSFPSIRSGLREGRG